MYYLGIDFGTTNCKSILYDENFTPLGCGNAANEVRHRAGGFAQQPAEEWWKSVKVSIRGALAEAGAVGEQIGGISVSSQGISFVPTDDDFTPLCDGISWLDTRAGEEAAEMEQILSGEELRKVTGIVPTGAYVLPKLLWLKKKDPALWKKTAHILTPHDWIIYRLCGAFITVPTMAAGTLLYDCRKKEWSDRLSGLYGVPVNLFGTPVWSGQRVGCILPEVAEELGISSSAAVVSGGQDQKCACLGAAAGAKAATLSLGTSAALSRRCETPPESVGGMVTLSPWLTQDGWILEGVVGTAGAALQWVRKRMLNGKSYRELDQLAGELYRTAGTEVLFCPDLAYSREGISGGGFEGLSLAAEEGDLWLAVLEGVAFRIREQLELMAEASGMPEALRIFGGGAGSWIWRQIIADVTGIPAEGCLSAETGCLGAAMLAAGAAGDVRAAEDICRPDPQKVAYYEKKYRLFRKLFG